MESVRIFSFKIRDATYCVEFKKGFGVTCSGLLPETGSALMVTEAVWPHRESSYLHYDNNYVPDVSKMVYERDLYDALCLGFQSWNRP